MNRHGNSAMEDMREHKDQLDGTISTKNNMKKQQMPSKKQQKLIIIIQVLGILLAVAV